MLRFGDESYTGSVAGGHAVQRAASERFIATGLELGGKDPMIVFADANLELAAGAAEVGVGVGGHQQKGDLRIARYNVSGDPNVADAASRSVLLTIEHSSQANHNGGHLAFGPDGYLYLTVGDEGYPNDVFNNSQRIDQILSLRHEAALLLDFALPNSHCASLSPQ